jgi:hypothetical protein
VFLRELPFGDIDAFAGTPAHWNFYAISDEDGTCQVEDFLNDLEGKLAETAEEMLAFLDGMVFDEKGPRRWIGTKRCHESVNDQRIFEFRIGDLRVHWFYGEGHAVVVLAIGALKQSGQTPKQLKKQLIKLRDGYITAVATKNLIVINA